MASPECTRSPGEARGEPGDVEEDVYGCAGDGGDDDDDWGDMYGDGGEDDEEEEEEEKLTEETLRAEIEALTEFRTIRAAGMGYPCWLHVSDVLKQTPEGAKLEDPRDRACFVALVSEHATCELYARAAGWAREAIKLALSGERWTESPLLALEKKLGVALKELAPRFDGDWKSSRCWMYPAHFEDAKIHPIWREARARALDPANVKTLVSAYLKIRLGARLEE